MATEHHEHDIKHMTENVRSDAMDEAMDDDTEDPGPFRQRSDPAVEPEDADIHTTTATAVTMLNNDEIQRKCQNQTPQKTGT